MRFMHCNLLWPFYGMSPCCFVLPRIRDNEVGKSSARSAQKTASALNRGGTCANAVPSKSTLSIEVIAFRLIKAVAKYCSDEDKIVRRLASSKRDSVLQSDA
jgi:hypothetical protein